MKKITVKKIKNLKKKIVVYFDDDTNIEINPNIISDFHLYVGKEIDNKLIKQIKESSRIENYFDLIVAKLKYENLTTKKINKILSSKNVKQKEIDKIINRLKKCNLLNEELLVQEVVEHADYKHYGYNKIIFKLTSLGISDELINKVKYNELRERKEARNYLTQLANKQIIKSDFQKRQFFYNSLIRNGFNPEVSLELVNKIPNSNKKDELNVLKLDYRKIYKKFCNKYKGNELKQKVFNSLLSKGYKTEDIKYVEDITHEMD